MDRRVTAVVTQGLLDELAAVLARPKFRRWVDLDDALGFVEALGREALLRPDPVGVARRVRDPDDDYLVALAEAAEAVIVTGDADLLGRRPHPAGDHASGADRAAGPTVRVRTPACWLAGVMLSEPSGLVRAPTDLLPVLLPDLPKQALTDQQGL